MMRFALAPNAACKEEASLCFNEECSRLGKFKLKYNRNLETILYKLLALIENASTLVWAIIVLGETAKSYVEANTNTQSKSSSPKKSSFSSHLMIEEPLVHPLELAKVMVLYA